MHFADHRASDRFAGNIRSANPLPPRRSRHKEGVTEMVNKDQVGGVMKQAKGTLKEAAGKATGNRRTEVEGKADKIAGKVQKGFGDVKEKIKRAM